MFIANCLFDLYNGSLQLKKLLVRLVLCLIFGYIFGVLIWEYARKKKISDEKQ